ncbi:uncharacterized protein LOC120340479 [Styela clava]
MPSKIKSNAIAAGSAGFLKPTFSSLSKAVDKNDNKLANFVVKELNNNDIKKQNFQKQNDIGEQKETGKEPIVLPTVVQESPLHSSTSATDALSHSNGSAKSFHAHVNNEVEKNDKPVEKNLAQALSASLILDHAPPDDNDTKIRDARKVCDELRLQIEDLKKQQQMFVTRLSGEYEDFEKIDNIKTEPEKQTEMDLILADPGVPCKNCDEVSDGNDNAAKDVRKKVQNFGRNALVNGARSNKPFSTKKVNCQSPSLSSDDGFNLHGSMTSDANDLLVKEEWLGSRGLPKDVPPTKVIKRLMSERERYKKKVKHLQQALHKLKKQHSHQSFGRTPDIAAHDIVYFNADLIGEGYLSYVYSGTIYKNQKAAIKKLIRPDMMSTSDRSYLAAEAGLLMALHHQNIVEVFGVSTAPLQPLIITELVKGRNLHDRLHSSDGWPLSPVEYYSIVRDITVGMAYLHGQKPPVLHLNLRPCNVLLDSTGRAKVADFGFSKIRLDAGVSNRANLSYLAPELLQFPVHLTTKLDVFSYAMIMWEMATMTKPHKDTSTSEILALVSSGKRLNIPCELPSGFHAIISRSWDQSPMQRPSFKELIIVLETMSLPRDWDDAIQRSKLNRTDTRGLITPRDDSENASKPVANSMQSDSKSGVQYPHIASHEVTQKIQEPDFIKERKRLSDELALESDMMTLGYNMTKPKQPHRTESADYLRGFKRSDSIPHHHHVSPQQKSTHSNRRSLALQLSPYKYNMINGSPVITHYHHRSSRNGNSDSRRVTSFGDDIHPHYKAARNLNQELSMHHEVRSPTRSNGHPTSIHNTIDYDGILSKDRSKIYHKKASSHHRRPKTGSLSSSETDNSIDNIKLADVPQPLTDRDMRYHDQNLTVETPKIVSRRSNKNPDKRFTTHDGMGQTSPNIQREDKRVSSSNPYLKNHEMSKVGGGRSSKNMNRKSRHHEVESASPRSPEDLRTAVSIPYLRNLRSGEESVSSSGNGTQRSHFDDKLSSYVSEACQAESRNYVDSRMKGWQSSRSAILNKEPAPPSSDYLKVRSIGTTIADQLLLNGQNKNQQTISESSETLMTAAYKPNEARRRELYNASREAKHIDDIISPTVSEDTLDETRRIGVMSVPSSSVTQVPPTRQSAEPPRRSRHISDGRVSEQNPRSVNPKLLRRENSWNKLKNSYSPEPLMPHFHSPFGTPEHSSNIVLPPAMNASESRDRPSAFSRPTHNSSKNTKRRSNRNLQAEKVYSQNIPLPRGWPIPNPVQEGISTESNTTNDEVGEALNDTARELAGVSEILETAVEQHKRDQSKRKNRDKTSKAKPDLG